MTTTTSPPFVGKRKNVRPLRVLVITFRRSLADKLEKDLVAAGTYVNYRSVDRTKTYGFYREEKLIVQVDSLPHVYPNERYDIVIVDEILSTILHTRSECISNHTAVITNIQFFMQQAKQVLLLDAAADDMPAYNFVCNIERIMSAGVKPVSAYWIHNQYVRPNNRLATIHICNSANPRSLANFHGKVLNRIRQLVTEQPRKRIFAPCSTAAHAKAIGQLLIDMNEKETLFKPIRFKVITGSSNESEKTKVNRNIEDELLQLDVFICSPAITAGPSFEARHFDHMVQYAENAGRNGCTVDSVMQQGARVRRLGDDIEFPDDPSAPLPAFTPGSNACIDIYVVDRPDQRKKAGPIDEAQLDSYMQVRNRV